MTKVIVIWDCSLDSYYEQTMDYLQAKYHTNPSDLCVLNIPPETESSMDYYEKLARNITNEAGIDGRSPPGKLVI